MKSKRIITMVVIVIIILAIVVLKNIIKIDLWDVNADLLKEEVLSIEQSVETVNLNDITPFEWDIAYSFTPYTPKDMIYKTVGYKWDEINETVNEGMNQIVFLKDGKVVCYLYGYYKNNGYGIYFTSEIETEIVSASVLKAEGNLTFQVERRDGVVYLNRN